MSEQLNIAQLFELVTKTLNQNREELNAADTHNHDHGNHVVEVFELITQVAKENPNLEAAEILERASALLRQKKTGTAQAYAEAISQGVHQLRGKPLTQQTLPLLMQALLGTAQGQQQNTAQAQSQEGLLGSALSALMGGGQPQPQAPSQSQASGGDLLTSALGALLGGGQAQPSHQQEDSGGMLGGLLNALMGGGQAENANSNSGIGLDDLMRAGSAFLQSSQGGKSTTEAALSALAAATGVGQTPHRAQSAKLVMQAIMQAAQMMGK